MKLSGEGDKLAIPPRRTVLSGWLDPASARPFHKGRVALHALLEAAGIRAGDEVLVPAFTCFVVAAAVVYHGARPVYYDLRPGTLNGNLDQALDLCTERTRVVIVQHTLGWPNDPSAQLAPFAARGIVVIEDCAHTIASATARGVVGSLGDAAFTSLQWSKPATLGLGGIARANSAQLAYSLDVVHRRYRRASLATEIALETMRLAHGVLVRPNTYERVRSLYRRLSVLGMLPGSSSSAELATAARRPDGYQTRMGFIRTSRLAVTLQESLRESDVWRDNYRLVASHMRDVLAVPELDTAVARTVPLRMPVLVPNRDELLRNAAAAGLECGDWFVSALHPLQGDLESLGYIARSCPRAEEAAASTFNIPIRSKEHLAQAPLMRALITRHIEQFVLDVDQERT